MQTLYFLRHGESQDNADRIWSRKDTPLTEQGRAQAMLAGQSAKAQGLAFDVIIASPLPRAHETARIFAEQINHDHEIEPFEMLVERDWGVLEGKSGESLFGHPYIRKDLEYVPSVEPNDAVHDRARQAVEYLKSRPESAILVVGHDSFGRAMQRILLDLPPEEEFDEAVRKRGRFDNAQLVHLI
jgi:broad specificity phosphatase PhoE